MVIVKMTLLTNRQCCRQHLVYIMVLLTSHVILCFKMAVSILPLPVMHIQTIQDQSTASKVDLD